MNKSFNEPVIKVYEFSIEDVLTTSTGDGGYNDNIGGGDGDIPSTYNSNYITVNGGLDENIPL